MLACCLYDYLSLLHQVLTDSFDFVPPEPQPLSLFVLSSRHSTLSLPCPRIYIHAIAETEAPSETSTSSLLLSARARQTLPITSGTPKPSSLYRSLTSDLHSFFSCLYFPSTFHPQPLPPYCSLDHSPTNSLSLLLPSDSHSTFNDYLTLTSSKCRGN